VRRRHRKKSSKKDWLQAYNNDLDEFNHKFGDFKSFFAKLWRRRGVLFTHFELMDCYMWLIYSPKITEDLIYDEPNPFLSFIKKDEQFTGDAIKVPICL